MIKRKTIILPIGAFVILAGLSLVLFYCFYHKSGTPDAEQNERIHRHLYIEYSDCFKVDADLPAFYHTQAEILTAKVLAFDDELIEATLFKDRIVEKKVDEGTIIYSDTKSTDDDPDHQYDYACLAIYPQDPSFSFSSREYAYVNFLPSFFAADYEFLPQMSNYSDYFAKDNLSFMSREDAIKDVSGKMSALGLEMPSDAEIYALDYNTLQSYWDDHRSEMEIFSLSKDETRTFT